MSDNKQATDVRDRSRISLSQDYEVKYWAEKFAISSKELTEAVKAAGPMAKDVEDWLKKKK